MHDLSSCVLRNTLIGSIRDLLPRGTFLVGGCIRDMLLGKEPLDYDLVTGAPVEGVARDIALRLGTKPFWLDERRGIMRIVMKPSGVSIDLSRFKGPDIGADLMARDLTINAMAWDLASNVFLDPSDGMDDLMNGLIRIISEKNLTDDPLRALRALRFSVTLDFPLREETSRLIRKHRDLLGQISPERVKLELERALEVPHSARFFRLLTWEGLIPVLFPPSLTGESDDRHLWLPVFSVALPIAEEMDQIIYAADALMPGSRALLEEETEAGVRRAALLRLASFILGLREGRLRDRRGEEAGDIAGHAADFLAGLRFSARSCRMLRDALDSLAPAEALLSKAPAEALDLYRFCERAAPVLPEALLLALVRPGEKGRRQAASLVWDYFESVYGEWKKSPLLTGREVMEAAGFDPGPRVGMLLAEVEEARAQGLVGSKEEALAYLHRIVA